MTQPTPDPNGGSPDPPTPTPQPPPTPPKATPTPSPPPSGDKGFPEHTSLTEMSGEQREAYWRHQAKKHEKTVKDQSDYGDLKTKAAEADRLRQEQETAAEKAVREAVEKARADTIAELRPQLVEARFHAAAAGRIDPDRLAALTEDIDMSRYLKDDGSVDVDKVAAKVEAWAPKKEEQRSPKPDPTQGSRNTKTSGIDVGREMSQARHKKKPAPSL